MRKFLPKISAGQTGKIRPVFGKNPPSNRIFCPCSGNFSPKNPPRLREIRPVYGKIRPVYGKIRHRFRKFRSKNPSRVREKSAHLSGLVIAFGEAFGRSCTLGRALPLCPLSELHQQSRKLCEGIRIPALTRAKAGIYVTAFRNSSTQNFIANKLARLVLIITYFAD